MSTRRCDYFAWALWSLIVAQTHSLHRRRYRSIAGSSRVSEFRRAPNDLGTFLPQTNSRSPHPFLIFYQISIRCKCRLTCLGYELSGLLDVAGQFCKSCLILLLICICFSFNIYIYGDRNALT